MKFTHALRFLFSAVILLTAAKLHAQNDDHRAHVYVDVSGTSSGTDYELVYGAQVLARSTSGSYASLPISDTLKVKVGEPISLSLGSAIGSSWDYADTGTFTVSIKAPTGYTVYVDGNGDGIPERLDTALSGTLNPLPEYSSQSYSFIVLEDRGTEAAIAGQLTRLEVGDFLFEVGLGTLKNGQSAGRLQLRSDGMNGGTPGLPSGAFWIDSLKHAVRPGSGVTWTAGPSSGLLETGQVQVVAAVDTGLLTTQYKLSFRAYETTAYASTPFAVYTVRRLIEGDDGYSASADGMRITEEQGTGAGKITVVHTILRNRTGNTWTVMEGASTEARRVTHDSGTSGSVRTETITTADYASAPEAVTKLEWTTSAGVERLTKQTVRTTPGSDTGALVTVYEYYGSGSADGDYGQLKKLTQPNLATIEYDYYDSAESSVKLGEIKTITEAWNTGATSGTMTQTKVTTLDYTGPAGLHADYVASQVITIGGVEVARTTHDYTFTTDQYTAITKNYYDTGSGSYLTTTSKGYRKDAAYFYAGRPLMVQYPDGRQLSYAYDSSGSGSRTLVIEGSHTSGTTITTADSATFESIKAVTDKSTLTVITRDLRDVVTNEKVSVYDGSVFDTANPVVNTTTTWLDGVRRDTSTAVNGGQKSQTWQGIYLVSEQDETGVLQELGYDSAGRLKTVKKTGVAANNDVGAGFDAQNAITTTYAYYATNLKKSVKESDGGSPENQRTTTYTYDAAGRSTGTALPDGRTSSTAYAFEDYDSRKITQVTETLACGGTVVTRTLPDGKTRSVVSVGVDEFYTYSIDATPGSPTLGRITTQVRFGTDTQTRWRQTVSDWLGRVKQVTRPGPPDQSNIVETSTHDTTTGLLTKVTRTGLADTYFGYDSLGRQTRSGLDLGGGGLAVADTADRITDQSSRFTKTSSQWWAVNEQSVFATASAVTEGAATPLGSARRQLTGLANGATKTEKIDRFGNVQTTTTAVDRTKRRVTITVALPGVTNPVVTETVNGLLVREKSPDGRTTDYHYDTLGRRQKVHDSRTNTDTELVYEVNPVGGHETDRIAAIIDGKEIGVVSYEYDAGGRVKKLTTPLGVTHSSYDCAGRLAAQWGTAVTPTRYTYDTNYGELTHLYTYRAGDYSTTEPTSGGDETEWSYDAASGVLMWKKDAKNRKVEYTYNSRGLPATRKWARSNPDTSRVITTYGYLPGSTELTSRSYNDDGRTPAVGYTYTRAGLPDSVTDATGTRTFAYTTELAPDTETLPAFYADAASNARVIKRVYDGEDRPTGFKLGHATTVDAYLTQTLGYAPATGLLETVQTGRGSSPTLRTFTYSYVTGSALVDKVGTGSGGTLLEADRDYDPDLDLLTKLETKYSSTSLTHYDYTYNDARQRATVKQSGTAFADFGDSIFYKYSYNERGELTAAKGYLGATVTDLSKPLAGRQYGYGYDTAGTRTSADSNTPDAHAAMAFEGTDGTTDLRSLNQLRTREHTYAEASGTVVNAGGASATTVVVNGIQVAEQQGNYWWAAIELPNTDGPARKAGLRVAAAKLGPDKQMINTATDLILPPRTEVFAYDEDGNLLSDGQWEYTWDAENQLIKQRSTLPTTGSFANYDRATLEFTYDHLGRRVQKQVTKALQTVTTRYLYDGWNVVAEIAASGESVGAITRSHTWGLDLTGSLTASGGVGALLQESVHDADGTTVTDYFPTYDGNGNVAALVDSAGTLAAVYEYGPFGEAIRTQVIDPKVKDNPWRFSTKYTDVESGLAYYGLRYYSPTLGRFINRDPIGEQGGVNLYGFVGNDPVNRWDVLGMVATTEAPPEPDVVYLKPITVRGGGFHIIIITGFDLKPDVNFRIPGLGGSPANTAEPKDCSDGKCDEPKEMTCEELAKLMASAQLALWQSQKGIESYGLSNIDRASLGALVGGTGVSAYGVNVAGRLAQNGRSLDYGMTLYTNITPGYARNVARAGAGLAGVGVGLDAYVFVDAARQGDDVGAGFAGANILADVGALALGGPAGLAIGIGQVGINVSLTAYTASWNAQLKEQSLGVVKQMAQTAQAAQSKIASIGQQMAAQGCNQ